MSSIYQVTGAEMDAIDERKLMGCSEVRSFT